MKKPNKLFNNIGLKILAVIFSVLLWLISVNVNDPVDTEVYRNIPVELENTNLLTDEGMTYEVLDVGDESKTVRNNQDTVAFRYTAKTVDDEVVDSSYDRGDTTRMAVGDLMPGLQQSVKLIGQGGQINVWIPARLAYGKEGDERLGIKPNATLFYEIELLEVKRPSGRR